MTLQRPTAKALTLAVLAAGLLAVLAANLPGQMSYDSIVQLADGRSGRYHLWHPPVMAWLLGLGDAVLPGTALYVTGVAALIFACLAVSVAVRPQVSWATPVLSLGLCASPLLLVDQGVVWKDMLFANATVGAFLLLSVGADCEPRSWDRRGVMAAAVALFTLAALARQNGLIAAVFGMGAVGFIAWRAEAGLAPRLRSIRAAQAAGLGFTAILVCTLGATVALNQRAANDPGPAGQLRLLKLYSLVGAAKADPSVDLSPLGPTLAAQLRAAGDVYTPQRVDPVAIAPGVADAVAKAPPGLDAAWRGLILHHPGAWMDQRLDVFRWMIAPPDVSRCLPFYTGVDGPLAVMKGLGLQPAWRAQDIRLAHYAALFLPTPLYIHAVWAVLAVGLIVWLWCTGRDEDVVLAIMLGATLAFTASFLLIGVACDHRYLYALDLSTMAALLHAVAGLRIGRRDGALA